ncbi:MAG TPA: hypothetical protein VLH84_04330 [Patescibacteria group bacterium]|nr:hypothetical protein [Patescibacteria group bacterium]
MAYPASLVHEPLVVPPAPLGGVEAALGSGAVHAASAAARASRDAADFHQAGQFDLAEEAARTAESHRQQMSELMDGVRSRLSQDERPGFLYEYLNGFIGDAFHGAVIGGHTSHRDIVSWLADRTQGATDAQLFTFLERHIQHIEKLQAEPQAREVINKTKQQYMGNVQEMVQAGWLSTDALSTLGSARDVRVVIGDIWDTYLQNTHGYFVDHGGQVYITIAPGTGNREHDLYETIRRVLPHELGHLQFAEPDMPDWFHEGMMEHFNRMYATGRPAVMNPDIRRETNSHYVAYRRLMAEMFADPGKTGGEPGGKLLRTAMLAASSRSDAPVWAEFQRLLDAKYGKDAFARFSADISGQAAALMQRGLPEHVAPEQATDNLRHRITSLVHGKHRPQPGGRRRAHQVGAAVLRPRRA